jgi:hypothetical protein
LDEFQKSTNPLQANFVQILSPTADQIPALGVRFSSTLRSNFEQLLGSGPGSGFSGFWAKVLKNFSTLSNLQYQQQTRLAEVRFSDYLISPSQSTERDRDSSRLATQLNYRQDVFFFRNGPQGELGFTWIENQSRQFLASGSEQRHKRTWQTQQRWNFGTNKSLENTYAFGFNTNEAVRLEDRNYNISFHRVRPQFNYQLNRKIRLTTDYEFQWKENLTPADTVNSQLLGHKVGFQGRFNIGGRNNINLKLELYQLNQNGQPNNTANFQMLEGLRAGNNAVWNIFVTWYLSSNLEFSLTYDGRASEARPPVHSGQMQIRALF